MSSLEMNAFEKLTQYGEKRGNDCPAYKRLETLFDAESFVETNSFVAENGSLAAVVCGYGTIDGNVVYAFSQDVTTKSGAITKAQGDKIKKIFDLAAKTGCPVVGIYDSKGAIIDLSGEALFAYGEMLAASNNLSGVVPQISIILGTCASSAAMVASSADIVIMSKNAKLFMNSPYVLKAKGEDAKNVDSALNAANSGVAHIITENEDDAIAKARDIIALLPINNIANVPFYEFNEPVASDMLDQIAKSNEKYCIKDVIKNIVDNESFTEIQKDYADGAVCGFATMAGVTIGVVATRKSKNDGLLTRDECSKIARFVRLCDSFSIGVLTIVDTNGFACSNEYESTGSVKQASMLAHAYAEATCAKVSLIIGDAIGAGFIALAAKGANADLSFAWPNAVISPLAPKTAAAILYKDEYDDSKDLATNDSEKELKYIQNVASPFNMAENSVIDNVISPSSTRDEVLKAFDVLAGKRVSKLPKKHGNIQI